MMSATLRICFPESTINYVKNPAFRYDTTGYAAFGSVISRTLTHARFGIASCQVVTNGAALYEGVNYRVNWITAQGPMTYSVYLRGTGMVRLRLTDNLSGKAWVSDTISLDPARWNRYEITGYFTGGNDFHLYVETDKRVQAATFYCDGFMIEPHEYATTYCDGDQDGCQWNVMENGSISTRSAYTRAGGRWITIMGDDNERDFKDLYMTVVGGLGVAPITNNTQPYADSPGSYFQRAKVNSRTVTFTFHAVCKDLLGKRPLSLDKLHSLRQALFDIIKPDRTSGGEEFLVEYKDGVYPMYLRMRYDAGLEGEWDIRNRWVNSFPVRFLVVSPFLADDSQEVATLSFKSSITANYAMQRIDGAWSEMNGGLSAIVRQFAIGRRGEIYAVGDFTRGNYKASAIDPLNWPNYVAYWDGTQWQTLSSGANGAIYSVAVAPNGDVYVTGAFTSIGGVACNRVAKWNGSAWSALGSGLNNTGYAVKITPDGSVYVGGAFTTAGGNAAYYCARWDGSSWHPLGTYRGMNATVYAIDAEYDGTMLYLGGAFTDEYSSPATLTAEKVVAYDPYLATFEDMGDGFDATVYRLKVTATGRVYAVGAFTASGTQSMMYVSFWNGSAWYNMGAGANATVYDIDVGSDGTVVAVGAFSRIGSVDADGIGYWNGTGWVPLDAVLNGSGYAVIRDRYGNIYVSFNGTLADFASLTTVNNPGKAEVPANFYVIGPGTLRWLENQSSRRRIYLDLALLDDEEIFISCASGVIKSSVRGDLSYALLPGSEIRSWKLLPGNNKVSALMVEDVAGDMRMNFSPRYWSADSTAKTESV